VYAILDHYFDTTSPGDIVSIMDDTKDPTTDKRLYANWKKKANTWLRTEIDYARQTSTGSGGGDGRTEVAVSEVIVMYANEPTATVSVEGIIESGAYGGCNAKTNPGNTCAAPSAVNPGGDSQ